ncbi:MAG: hypothetical protein H8D23_27565 [Candidatus Brocadiales bacterium]|nr:hypothetical protein [Candidatus Brocadiales bacterium]
MNEANDRAQRNLQQAKQSFTGVGNKAPNVSTMTEGVPVYAKVGSKVYEFIKVGNQLYSKAYVKGLDN